MDYALKPHSRKNLDKSYNFPHCLIPYTFFGFIIYSCGVQYTSLSESYLVNSPEIATISYRTKSTLAPFSYNKILGENELGIHTLTSNPKYYIGQLVKHRSLRKGACGDLEHDLFKPDVYDTID